MFRQFGWLDLPESLFVEHGRLDFQTSSILPFLPENHKHAILLSHDRSLRSSVIALDVPMSLSAVSDRPRFGSPTHNPVSSDPQNLAAEIERESMRQHQNIATIIGYHLSSVSSDFPAKFIYPLFPYFRHGNLEEYVSITHLTVFKKLYLVR